jgi:hypothetical protein
MLPARLCAHRRADDPATQLRATIEMRNRRDFLIDSARALAGASLWGRSVPVPAQPHSPADYTVRIAPIRLEIAPGKFVKTTAFNGKVPGDLIRVREGRQVTIDVVNETDAADIVHWHGLQTIALVDGVTAPHGTDSHTHSAKPRNPAVHDGLLIGGSRLSLCRESALATNPTLLAYRRRDDSLPASADADRADFSDCWVERGGAVGTQARFA